MYEVIIKIQVKGMDCKTFRELLSQSRYEYIQIFVYIETLSETFHIALNVHCRRIFTKYQLLTSYL